MIDGLCVLLMEDESGAISLQLFANKELVKEPFDNLKGSSGNKKSRATLIQIGYTQEDTVYACAKCKVLPIVESIEGMPDGYILGQGPVTFEKEDKKE